MHSRKLFSLAALFLVFALVGCGGGGDKKDDGELKTAAPVNNNAPEAKNAPAAESNPSIPYPGKGKGGAAPK